MGLNLLDRIQAKIELFRLEQRYTRRRNRRSTFVSNATYVDGEYVYNSPNTTGSSYNTSRSQPPAELPSPSAESQQEQPAPSVSAAQKRLNRWSSMPGFGSNAAPSPGPSSSDSDSEEQRHQQHQQHQDWRRKRMSYAGGAA